MLNISKQVSILIVCCFLCKFSVAQADADTAYLNVVKKRANKIVSVLEIQDSSLFYNIRDKVAQEYVLIRNLDEKKERKINEVKISQTEKNRAGSEINAIESAIERERQVLNTSFIQSLSERLTDQQVEKVKNGLTYNVLPLTYQSFIDMIPSLKEEEKSFIYSSLVEAREYAMAAGSSKAKHGWFGEYKGRINNYLMRRGYDLKLERKNWYERMKEKKD